MSGVRRFVPPLEGLLALTLALMGGLAAITTADTALKYRLAGIAGLAGFALLAAFPERRIVCLLLWILIHPLGVEKVFFVDAAEGPHFTDPSIAINVSDFPLALLALFLLAETLATGRLAFRWSRLATILLALLIWSLVSVAVHAIYLGDGFVTSAPLALMQDVRLLLFVLLVQSAVRTRGDVVLALAAVAVALLLQSLLVGVAYGTGRVLTYAAALNGVERAVQGFDAAGGGELARATGTVGHTNEQAMFHAFMTIPLIAFFVVRNRLIRFAGLAVFLASGLALVLTFSRGAWLSFPAGLAVCGVIAYRRRLIGRTARKIGALLLLAGAAGLLLLANPIYQRLARGDTGATASRLRMLVLATDLFRSNPLLGVGPGEFAEAAMRLYPPGFHETQWLGPNEKPLNPLPTLGRLDLVQGRAGPIFISRPLPVHNKYMLMLSELGLPGLLIWLWFYVAFIGAARRGAGSADPFLGLVGIAGLGVAAAQLLYMMLDLFAEDKPLEIMLFVPALVLAASRCQPPAAEPA